MSPKNASRHYDVQVTLRAPAAFVYRWCTDYSAADGRYSGEGYQRRILRRSKRQIVFEDLYDTEHGWIWVHRTVTLEPPLGWHANSIGSDRRLSVDYRLSELPGDRTRLDIHAQRQPYAIGTSNPTKFQWERNVAEAWKKFGRILAREYREGEIGGRSTA